MRKETEENLLDVYFRISYRLILLTSFGLSRLNIDFFTTLSCFVLLILLSKHNSLNVDFDVSFGMYNSTLHGLILISRLFVSAVKSFVTYFCVSSLLLEYDVLRFLGQNNCCQQFYRERLTSSNSIQKTTVEFVAAAEEARRSCVTELHRKLLAVFRAKQ